MMQSVKSKHIINLSWSTFTQATGLLFDQDLQRDVRSLNLDLRVSEGGIDLFFELGPLILHGLELELFRSDLITKHIHSDKCLICIKFFLSLFRNGCFWLKFLSQLFDVVLWLALSKNTCICFLDWLNKGILVLIRFDDSLIDLILVHIWPIVIFIIRITAAIVFG